MPRGRPRKGDAPAQKKASNGATPGFEAQLFLAADKLSKNLEPSDYKRVALGLIFLRHISVAFEARHAKLLAEDALAAEDPDEYLADNIFWVPAEARWFFLQASARQPTIGKLVDDAMKAIEDANANLKGVLPKDYNRPALDKVMLGELIDLISGIARGRAPLDQVSRARKQTGDARVTTGTRRPVETTKELAPPLPGRASSIAASSSRTSGR